jgi:hypothetical protein
MTRIAKLENALHFIFVVTAIFVGLVISDLKGSGVNNLRQVLIFSLLGYLSIRYVSLITRALCAAYSRYAVIDLNKNLTLICLSLIAFCSGLLLV